MSDNPLSKLYRNKKIFITLPSKGKYYPSGINLSIDGDIGIMPMTAKDEILLKTPDALFNGNAMIEMIKSCVPDIKNPEELPACDLDPIILSIRMASKKTMDFDINCPHCNNNETYEIDLKNILGTCKPISENNEIVLDANTSIYVRPYSLNSQLKANIQKFHHGRMEYILSENTNISEDQKIEMFKNAFLEASNLTVELVSDNIQYIKIDDMKVSNKEHIHEWVENIDKELYKEIIEKIKSLSNSGMDNKLEIKCVSCNSDFTTVLDINPTNFFI